MTSRTPNPSRASSSPRRRVALPLGVAAWALLEIWLLTLVGQATGGLAVFLILVSGFVVGAAVIKQAGRRAWQRLSASLQPGASPEEIRDTRGGSALTMLGGLLLMVPGLISDAVGLLCVFPPTAALLRRGAARVLSHSRGPLGTVFQEARATEEQIRIRRQDGRVVRGEVVRDDEGDHGGGSPGHDQPRP